METLEVKNVRQKTRIAIAFIIAGVIIELIGAIWYNLPSNFARVEGINAVVTLMTGVSIGTLGIGMLAVLPKEAKVSVAT